VSSKLISGPAWPAQTVQLNASAIRQKLAVTVEGLMYQGGKPMSITF